MAAIQRIITHPALTVTIKEGTEGPVHDFYHYSEYHATTKTGITIYHRGALGAWISHNGHRIDCAPLPPHYRDVAEYIEKELFEQISGFKVSALHRIYRKLHSYCRKCGSRETVAHRGHPGETIFVCGNCGHPHSAYFCEASVT